LTTALLLAAMTVACFAFHKPPRIKAAFIILFLVFMAGFLVNVLAPGHAVRQAGHVQTGVIAAIAKSFYYACIDLAEWLDLRMVSALLFLSPIFCRMARQTGYPFKHPLLVLLFSFCFCAAGHAPTAYAISGPGDPRVRNIIYFSFVLLVFLNYFYIVGYMERFVRERQISLDKDLLVHCACVAGLFAVVLALSSAGQLKQHTSFLAAKDLFNGTARQFAMEMNEHLKILRDDRIKQAELPPLSVRPELFTYNYVFTDKDAMENQQIAIFYQKEYVVVNKELGNSP
jgi:hypothetical protein